MRSVLIAAVLASGCVRAPIPYHRLSTEKKYELFEELHARLEAGETAKQLEDRFPGLELSLATAMNVSAKRWTESTTFDELAKQEILSTAVLDHLGIRHQTTGGVTHVPAGVIHSYGYLFSQLKTGFGLKGKRWIEAALDERLGLPSGMLSPFPPSGELLSNLTRALDSLIADRSTERVIEKVDWQAGDRVVHSTVRSYLAKLRPTGSSDTQLLIYSFELDGDERLVTCFPVGDSFARSIKETTATGTFRPRFNLYVDPTWVPIAWEVSR